MRSGLGVGSGISHVDDFLQRVTQRLREQVLCRFAVAHLVRVLGLLGHRRPPMTSKLATPKAMNLPRLISEYGDEQTCRSYLESIRWPQGVTCPRDGKNATWLGTVEVWECNSCHYQFTVRVGSVLQDSKLPLTKWLIAVFLVVEAKKGIS